MNEICDECGKEYDLPDGGVLMGDSEDCNPFIQMIRLCNECYAKTTSLETN